MSVSAPDALRPETLADFAGQPEVTRELGYVITAARNDQRLPPHILFSGPPGLGKTTLSAIVARELDLPMVSTSGPAIDKPAELASLLTSLARPAVVFVDEIHAMPRQAEELLYSAMEDGMLDIPIGEGRQARTIRLPLTPFVLVGATTASGKLSGPLRMRFGYRGRLRLYNLEDLTSIVGRSAALLEVELADDAAAEIAARSQQTPRVANNNLRQVRDYASACELDVIDHEVAVAGLEAFGVDRLGLDHLGRELLDALCRRFAGGPVGVKTLASTVGETATTLEEEIEPYLMRAGLLDRSLRGRLATPAAFEHLGIAVPDRYTQQIAAGTPNLFEAAGE